MKISLRVKEAHSADPGYSRARIDQDTREKLGVKLGDPIVIEGVRSTSAVAHRLFPDEEGRGIIRMDGILRKNAGVSVDDAVTVKAVETTNAEKVTLAFYQTVPDVTVDDEFLGYVMRNLLMRPMMEGDVVAFPISAFNARVLPFRVMSTEPEGVVLLTKNSQLSIQKEAEAEEEERGVGITYEEIGGLKNELMRVREMIEFPLKRPELFRRLGIDPPRGVLLYGPPGTGKTLIAKAVANESGATFFLIQGPEIVSKYYGESEEHLRRKFEMAEEHAPAIIFIDELDSIAPKREESSGELERRIVAQLLTLMDGMVGRGQVIVIGATNRVDAIDPALRRPGRFDREIMIGVPDKSGRKEILEIHTRGMPLTEDFDLERIEDITHGFTGADLAALSREAAMRALRRLLPTIDVNQSIPPKVLEELHVSMNDFIEALKGIEPSALRSFYVELPDVRWSSIGGLDDVIEDIKEAVEWPLEKPEVFTEMGVRPPRGILLFGPPGTGKTLMAKAAANEVSANFIPVRGPEVMSKWVGESEKAIREIFKLAKMASPSIILLDELDALAPSRGLGAGRAQEQVVNQLLSSLDGLEQMKGVVVIGTTNRPDIIDPALLRAGRFDRRIFVKPPGLDGRRKILEIHTSEMPMKGVDLDSLATQMEGFVGADIEAVCREAGMMALRKGVKTVKMAHFETALDRVGPSMDESTAKFYEKIAGELEGVGRRVKDDVEGYR